MDGRVFECKLLSCEGFYSVGYCTVERASGVFSRSSTPDAIDDCVGRFNKKTPFSTHLGVGRLDSKPKCVKTPDASEMRQAFYSR